MPRPRKRRRACAFYQTDGGGWSYDIPTRVDDDHEVDGLDRAPEPAPAPIPEEVP